MRDPFPLRSSWMLAQRAAARSVLLIHHAGKGGGQRGTSRKEDVLDTVISLSRRWARYDADAPMSRGTFNSVTYAVVEQAKKEGLPLEPFTVHNLRTTGSTLLNELGFNSDWIEKCLAHEDGRSSLGVYNKVGLLRRSRWTRPRPQVQILPPQPALPVPPPSRKARGGFLCPTRKSPPVPPRAQSPAPRLVGGAGSRGPSTATIRPLRFEFRPC